MKIQFASDLHLEFTPENINVIENAANILCLCGDIAVCGNEEDFNLFKTFIKKLSEMKFLHILHIAGNHEYYCSKRPGIKMKAEFYYQKINEKLVNLSLEFPKYKFLNNSHFDYKTGSRTIRFIGTTLWTHIPASLQSKGKAKMNDYSQIIINAGTQKNPEIRKLLPSDVDGINAKSRIFIKQETAAMKKSKNITGVLLVHHKPIWDRLTTTIGKSMYEPEEIKKADPYDYFYSNDLLTIESPIKCVVYGHTHKKDNRIINGIRYVSNPRGYPGELNTYNKKETVEI